MSAEKFFWGESSAFLFVFVGLFGFLYGVSGAVWWCFVVRICMVCGAVLHGLWCASMLSSVTFRNVVGAVGLREEKFQEKKGAVA